jgi:hypothetical protein
MLRYLDNWLSAGPHSRVVAFEARRANRMDEGPRVSGINENLAREVLELHTLGAEGARAGVYTQADVTSFAAVLTGWRIARDPVAGGSLFDANWHEPGRKTVLGKSYGEGPDALREVLHDLARHPATAHFVSTKLARHFVADEPPPALVDRLTTVYLKSDGQLGEVYRELIRHEASWNVEPAKLKTPEEFVVSTARILASGDRSFERPSIVSAAGASIDNPVNPIAALGQRPMAAPSPAGWSDRAEDWLGPDAVWKRVEWATRLADRAGRSVDARRLAMRHPVSTPICFEEQLSGAMLSRVVGFAIGPGAPDDAQPGAGEDADGVRVVAAAGLGLGVDMGGPGIGVARVVGHAGESGTQSVVASPAEGDGLGLARLVGDRSDAGLGGELSVGCEALAHAAELGQDLRSADAPGAREAHQDLPSSREATWCSMRLRAGVSARRRCAAYEPGSGRARPWPPSAARRRPLAAASCRRASKSSALRLPL